MNLVEMHDFARELALAGGETSLEYFRSASLAVELKADRSPVTAADRGVEREMRSLVAKRFPDHAIIGEELGSTQSAQESEWTWIFDPIDGTKSFIRGVPLYTTLVALLHHGIPRVGVVYAPATGEMVSAYSGGGARDEKDHLLRVSGETDPAEAWVMVTDPKYFHTEYPEIFRSILRRFGGMRTWADAYGYLLVARGDAHVMIDPVMSPWDVAPLGVIIREAGGRFTGLDGSDEAIPSSAVASCTAELHTEVLALTRRKSP